MRVAAAFMLAIAFPFQAVAAQAVSAVKATGAQVREVPESSANTAAYMVLENSSPRDLRLVRAESPAAKAVELHTHLQLDGMMKMQQVPAIPVPAQGKVELRPSGYHLMVIGLKPESRKAKSIELTLHFSDGSKLKLIAPFKPFSPRGP